MESDDRHPRPFNLHTFSPRRPQPRIPGEPVSSAVVPAEQGLVLAQSVGDSGAFLEDAPSAWVIDAVGSGVIIWIWIRQPWLDSDRFALSDCSKDKDNRSYVMPLPNRSRLKTAVRVEKYLPMCPLIRWNRWKAHKQEVFPRPTGRSRSRRHKNLRVRVSINQRWCIRVRSRRSSPWGAVPST